ncbi:hypothetical protein B9Z55_000719 [Caenorhabditis nigoni]|uniref:Uncharacterized protein n=1 Tax=Caenorhabditis nigoni TaxID=1611254 RepID=A0A2G5VV57_9PELO|nr:hypothetical protein B9Z55_000719 [Caenorhabditis nigoni]
MRFIVLNFRKLKTMELEDELKENFGIKIEFKNSPIVLDSMKKRHSLEFIWIRYKCDDLQEDDEQTEIVEEDEAEELEDEEDDVYEEDYFNFGDDFDDFGDEFEYRR